MADGTTSDRVATPALRGVAVVRRRSTHAPNDGGPFRSASVITPDTLEIRRRWSTSRVEVTTGELRVRSAPWRRVIRIPTDGLQIFVREARTRDGSPARGYALLAIRPGADSIPLLTVDDLDTAEALERLLEEVLGIDDQAVIGESSHRALQRLTASLDED